MGWFGRSQRRPADVPIMRIDMDDETGRVISDDAYRDIGVSREQDAVETKKGYISHKLGLALTELELNPDTWIA